MAKLQLPDLTPEDMGSSCGMTLAVKRGGTFRVQDCKKKGGGVFKPKIPPIASKIGDALMIPGCVSNC